MTDEDAKRIRVPADTVNDPPNQTKRLKTLGSSALSVLNSNDCITFHLLKKLDGTIVMEEDGHFTPEMTHQLFDEEKIKGYDGLEIDIFFTPAFKPLIDVKYVAQADRGATNLKKPFKEAFSAGFFEAKPDFDTALNEEAPLTALPLNSPIVDIQGEDSTLKIFRYNLATAPDAIKTLHARLEPLLYFFVEAASAIDASDPSWDFLLALKYDLDGALDVAAFATVHKFYVFPDRCRLRLSQVLVLPPFQGQGIGSKIIDAVYLMAESENAVDITLEDPIDDLRRLRDRKDLTAMLPLDWLRQQGQGQLDNVLKEGKGKKPLEEGKESDACWNGKTSALSPSPETLSRIQKELRMSKQQSQRMWENLLYALAANANELAVAAVEGYIRGNFEAQVASAKKGSEGKVVVETPTGFVMLKSKKAAAPGAIPVQGVTAVQQQEAIADAVACRIEEMQRVLGIKVADEEEEEDGQ